MPDLARLRALEPADFESQLAVVSQLRTDPRGLLRPDAHGGAWERAKGVRVREAPTALQLGLTADEIDGVVARWRALLEAVDDGRIGVF